MRPSTLREIRDAAVRLEGPIARARYEDGFGHPVVLQRDMWPEAMALRGDHGARTLVTGGRVVEVTIDGPAPPDLDTPDAHREALTRPAPE